MALISSSSYTLCTILSAIKSREQISWFGDQLSQVLGDTASLIGGLEVKISLYVTCDENLDTKSDTSRCLSSTAQ